MVCQKAAFLTCSPQDEGLYPARQSCGFFLRLALKNRPARPAKPADAIKMKGLPPCIAFSLVSKSFGEKPHFIAGSFRAVKNSEGTVLGSFPQAIPSHLMLSLQLSHRNAQGKDLEGMEGHLIALALRVLQHVHPRDGPGEAKLSPATILLGQPDHDLSAILGQL